MLPVLNLASLANAISTVNGAESPGNGLGFTYESSDANPFVALAQQMGFSFQGGEQEQELAAFLTELKSKIGEELPLESPQLPMLAAENSEELLAPETLTGDALLAYLMANAGERELKAGQPSDESESLLLNDIDVTFFENDNSEADAESEGDLPEAVLPFSTLESQDEQGDALDSVEVELDPSVEGDDVLSGITNQIIDDANDEELNAEVDEAMLSSSTLESNLEGQIPTASTEQSQSADPDTLQPLPLTHTEGEVVDSVSANPVGLNDETTLKPEAPMAPQPVTPKTVQAGVLTEGEQIQMKDDRRIQASMLMSDEPVEEPLNSVKPESSLKPVVGEAATAKTLETQTQTGEQKPGTVTSADGKAAPRAEPVNTIAQQETTFSSLAPNTPTVARQPLETLQTQALNKDATLRPMKLENFGNALADRIQTMVAGELKHAIIRLDPPELGSLEVRVQVQQEQTQIQIVTQSTQVRDALEQHSARLREALAEQGLDLANLDVSDQTAQGDAESNQGGSGEGGVEGDIEETTETVVAKTVGLVDQYV